jgi:hypothetical protein
MLDADHVLQEAEALLDEHYIAWQQRGTGHVRVYEKPAQPQLPPPAASASATMTGTGPDQHRVTPTQSNPAKTTDVSEVVANVFLFLFLTVLSNKFTRGPAR